MRAQGGETGCTMWVLGFVACIFGGGAETDVVVPPIGSQGDTDTTTGTTGPQGEMDIEDFVAEYPVVYCDTWDVCITSDPCDANASLAANLPGCGYDAEKAYACVNGTWTCDERFPDTPLPLPPEACDEVYDCTDSYFPAP